MKVLLTGAAGALGRNFVENLKVIRDGKNRTRPNIQIDAIYEYDRDNTEEELNKFCSDCNYHQFCAGFYFYGDNWKACKQNESRQYYHILICVEES